MVERNCCTKRKHEFPYSLHLKIKNPLNIHEIPEWHLQTPTWIGIFHPRNWPRQETSHPLALSLFTNANFSNDQKLSSFFALDIYKVSKLSMGRIPSKRCIPTLVGKRFQRMPLVQQFLVSHFHQITCGSILASLTPLSALLEIFLSLKHHTCQISSFRSYLCHSCHSIFIIVVIDLGYLVQVSH